MLMFNQFNLGDVLGPIESEKITQEWLQKYARLSGDSSPLHLEEGAAQKAGFPTVIAHGMLSMAIMTRLVSSLLNSPLNEAKVHAHFVSPLYLGDRLIIDGKVSHINDEKTTLTIKLRGKNQLGKVILKGYVNVEKNNC